MSSLKLNRWAAHSPSLSDSQARVSVRGWGRGRPEPDLHSKLLQTRAKPEGVRPYKTLWLHCRTAI